ncbi:MAG: hypothetical protein HKN11_04290 [Rhizobiales bacterium]|nr:hypothetical protein [Hyphomicrobiales bacterium]
MQQFIEGPLWTFAATVFLVGVAWRIVAIMMIGKPKDLTVAKSSSMAGAAKSIALHSVPHGGNLSRTIYHVISGYAFHLGLFALLFLAAPHVTFISERIVTVPWPAMPRWAFIIAAEAAFAGLILLYLRRLTDPIMRQLSDWDDHVGTWLTFLAMLTGCLALQESHIGLRLFHMVTVQVWMIYFPFSRLMHAFTFAMARKHTGATYGRRGFTP